MPGVLLKSYASEALVGKRKPSMNVVLFNKLFKFKMYSFKRRNEKRAHTHAVYSSFNSYKI